MIPKSRKRRTALLLECVAGLPQLLIGLLAAAAVNAAAASFNVNPIGFSLLPGQSTSVLRIANPGDQPVRVQVGALDWTTDGHKEIMTESDALILNPPIFSIAPGKTQYLRFGLRHPIEAKTEKTYRLLIEEVPSGAAPAGGLQTLLRISIPVFIVPSKIQEVLSWHVRRDGDGAMLSVANSGNVHGKIIRIRLSDAAGRDLLRVDTPVYVLPGQRKQWFVPNDPLHAGEMRLRIQTDKGEIEEFLMLETDLLSGR
jgi:fimbrial chaperone protein